MIRKAKVEDIKHLVRLAHEAHERSIYSHLEVDDLSLKKTYAFAIGSKQMFLWVSERDGEVNGFLLGGVGEIGIPGIKGRAVSDMLFYVSKGGEGLALAKGFIKWGWEQPNVETVGFTNSSGIETERVNKLIERMGMAPTVTIFTQFKEDRSNEQSIQEGI